jgi:hypothetical protein
MTVLLIILLGTRVIQSSWYLGSGELGPVEEFGEAFYTSSNIAYLYELQRYLTLSPKKVDTSNWESIIIDENDEIDGHNFILPYDIDKDRDFDLIGCYDTFLIWYEQYGNKQFQPHIIGGFEFGHWGSCWGEDLDNDNDIDIIVAGEGGLGWFKNNSLRFEYFHLASNMAHYGRGIDVDNDEDKDIIVQVGKDNWKGDLWLFENQGNGEFSPNGKDLEIENVWRTNIQDFNKDGYEDIQTTEYKGVAVYLNNRDGTFYKSFYEDVSGEADGSWPADFNADGYMDIMGNGRDGSFMWFENDGTGTNFTPHEIETERGNYGDGGMACDINLDGRNDIIGGYKAIGWIEQCGNGEFKDHLLGQSNQSHWVYGFPVIREVCGFFLDNTADIMFAEVGRFGLWHNKMVESYQDEAYLESSIIEVDTTGRVKWVKMGWCDCIPEGFEVRYKVRAANSVTNLITTQWEEGFVSNGNGSDERELLGVEGKYLQYRIEIIKKNSQVLSTPIIDTVWVEWEVEEPQGVEERITGVIPVKIEMRGEEIVYTIPYKMEVGVKLYDVSGRVLRNISKKWFSPGEYSFPLPSIGGVYFLRVHTPDKVIIKKFTKIK